jgi:hypothetical protein
MREEQKKRYKVTRRFWITASAVSVLLETLMQGIINHLRGVLDKFEEAEAKEAEAEAEAEVKKTDSADNDSAE